MTNTEIYSRHRVLLTDGNYKHTWAAARAISGPEFEVDVVGSKHAIASCSRFVNENVFEGYSLEDENLSKFLDLVQKRNYAAIIGVGANSIQFLAKHRELIGRKCNLILPPNESLEICLNKYKTLNFVSDLGIRVPHSFHVASYSQLVDASKTFSSSFIVKCATETDKGFATQYFNNSLELLNLKSNFLQNFNGPLLIQQRIFGAGEGFFAIYRNGSLIDYFMHKRIREIPISGGPSTRARSINETDLYDLGKKILDALNWHGLAMVEFKRDENGELCLIEINPKLWGSLDLAISAGVNFPRLATEIALGFDVQPLQYHATPTEFQWPFDGDLSLILKNPRMGGQITLDLVNPKIAKNIYFQDLKPTFRTIKNRLLKFLFGYIKLELFNSLAYKIYSNGLIIGFTRWFDYTFGFPTLRYCRVENNLFVGGKLSRIGIRYLYLRGFKSILNLRGEFDDSILGVQRFKYLQIKCVEFQEIDTKYLQLGVDFMTSELKAGKKIYVHCAEGVSRAPSFVVAYLIAKGFGYDEAVSQIQKSRPFINILDRQMHSINKFKDLQA